MLRLITHRGQRASVHACALQQRLSSLSTLSLPLRPHTDNTHTSTHNHTHAHGEKNRHYSLSLSRGFATRRRRVPAESLSAAATETESEKETESEAEVDIERELIISEEDEDLNSRFLSFTTKRYKPAITPEDDLSPEQREEREALRWERARERDAQAHAHAEEEEEEEDNEGEAKVRMAKRLFSLSRVPYRHIPDLPDWFYEKQREIYAHRTSAQIRRCLKSWMVKYDADLMQKYRLRALGWREESPSSPNAASPTTEQKPLQMVYGPEETTAYAYFHMPARFSVQQRVFAEIKQLLQQNNSDKSSSALSFTPRRVLDFGCGPATAAAAAASVWPGEITHYAGVDVSQAMLDAGRIMTRDLLPNATFWSRNADVVQRALTKNERFDLIVASYTLTELPTDVARKAATQLLFELLDVNGVLVLVEAGSPQGSHTVRTARQFLLDMMKTVDEQGRFSSTNYLALNAQLKELEKNDSKDGEEEQEEASKRRQRLKAERELKKRATATNLMILPPPFVSPAPSPAQNNTRSRSPSRPVKADREPETTLRHNDLYAKIVAPCTHDRACPLRPGSWCSFAQRVRSATIRKDSEEKYSYVVVQKLLKPNAARPSGNDNNKAEERDREWVATSLREMQSPENIFSPQTMSEASPLEIINAFTNSQSMDRDEEMKALVEEVDWDNYTPRLKREEFGRLIRSPLKGKGHVTLDLCLPDGSLQRHVHARSDLALLPRAYNAMRKSSWGGLLPAFMITHPHTAVRRSREKTSVVREEKDIVEKRRETRRRAIAEAEKDFDEDALKKALDDFLATEQEKEKKQQDKQKRTQTQTQNEAVRVTDVDVDISAAGAEKSVRSKTTRRRVVRSTSSLSEKDE